MTRLADRLPTASLLLFRTSGPSTSAAGPASELDAEVVLSVLGEHAEDLLRMARLITGSDEVAQTVVSNAFRSSAAGAHQPRRCGTEVRTALVSATFYACRDALAEAARAAAPTNDPINWLARIRDQQRAAVALHLYGAQSPAQISSLLNLPLRSVCLLLLLAMDEIIGVEPARPSRGRGGSSRPSMSRASTQRSVANQGEEPVHRRAAPVRRAG